MKARLFFSEPVLPHSFFIEPNFDKMFVDIFLPCDYKTFNDKVVVAYFKDGTKEKAVVQDGDTFDVNTGLEICILKHIGTRYGINFQNAFRKNKKAIDKKHEKDIAKKVEAERKKNAAKAKLERNARKRKSRLILLLKQLSRLSVLMMVAIVKDNYKIFIIKE